MLAHYSRWIPNFSEKIYALVYVNKFLLLQVTLHEFETLKKYIANSVTEAIDPNSSLTVETDASKYAIASILTQKRCPVAFLYFLAAKRGIH